MKTSFTFALSLLTTAVFMAGCADLQDGGDDNRTNINGLVVDGRVANGLVWIDLNQNGKLDKDFEPYARTDAQGYYSYNPDTQVNYCQQGALDLPAYQSNLRHCLLFGASYDPILLRVRGGIDLDTGERLKGSMSMETTISDASKLRDKPMIMSPLTSLLRHGEAEQGTLLEALGIEIEDLFLDFSELAENFDNLSDTERDIEIKKRAMYADAVTLQTLQTLLSDSTDLNSVQDQDALMKELATLLSAPAGNDQVAGQATPTPIPPTNQRGLSGLTPGQLQGAFNKAIPTDKRNDAKTTQLATRAEQMIKVLTSAAGKDEQNPKDTVKALEVLMQLVIKEAKGEDVVAVQRLLGSDLTARAEELRGMIASVSPADGDNSAKVDLDLQSLTQDLLKDARTNENPSVQNAVNSSRLSPMTWGGQWLVFAPSSDDIDQVDAGSRMAIRLSGTGGDSSGTLGVCINATLLKVNDIPDGITPDNEFLSGRWSRLNSGTLALTLNYSGIEYDGILRNIKTGERMRLSTELTDEQAVLNIVSNQGFDQHEMPRNKADCKNILTGI